MSGSDLPGQAATYGTIGVPAATNVPSARFGAVTWIDASGNFWLFGGFSADASGQQYGTLNDLWKYSNGQWIWESGSQMMNQSGVYGVQGLPAPANVPGGRQFAVGWSDVSGDLWLFGGAGSDANGHPGWLNDLWKYSNGQWTWVSGSSVYSQPGVYGVQGTAAAANTPGSRQEALSWTDSSGNFWLFGGNGLDSATHAGLLNDLWKFNSGEWTWVSGSHLINQFGVYGSQGSLAPGNIPGARGLASGWRDANGNLWLFGGYGTAASGSEGNLSDLWMYMP
jgi:N-acetylneuraminic acid mutarotase